MADKFISDVIQWDVLNWSRTLGVWSPMLDRFEPGRSRVLALGEREGGLSLWFAQKGFQVVCSDITTPQTAHQLHTKYGVTGRIEYANLSAFEIPFRSGSFDIVVCKSVIGGLKLVRRDAGTRTFENHIKAAHEIYRVLKPGGCWLGAENMRGTPLHHGLRRWAQRGRLSWRYIAVEEWEQLLAPFARREVEYFGLLPTTFSSGLLNRISYRLNRTLCPHLPADWNYIAFFAAFRDSTGDVDPHPRGFRNVECL